ncbi:MAG: sulfite exporter TauE/SafE family protein [Armatimonadota bacterium]|nr:sulfite exporter TauE/SafE family protein [Armatimonadota bacterium]
MVEIAAGVTANLYLLAALGLGVGLIAGFAGVSGGYLLTPILIVLGFPAPIAVGTGLALMTANTLIAVIRHRELGHLDLKMGIILAAGTMIGAEGGVRLLDFTKGIGEDVANVAVLAALLLTLATVAISMAREVWHRSRELSRLSDAELENDSGALHTPACHFLQGLCIFPHIRFTKSKLRISGWIVFFLGAAIGVLSGFLGVGGCFMRAPALIYLVGQPSLMAVGTNLLGAFIGVAFSCFRHAMLGHVHLGVALVMLLGTSIGTQIGASGTSWLKGLAVRYVLTASVAAALFGPAFKMAYFVTGSEIAWLDHTAKIVTVAQIFVPVTIIVGLLVMAFRHFHGKGVPRWARRLMAGREHAAAG